MRRALTSSALIIFSAAFLGQVVPPAPLNKARATPPASPLDPVTDQKALTQVDDEIGNLQAQMKANQALPIVTRNFLSDIQLAGPIDPLVAELRSDQFTKRDQASRALLRLGPERLSDVKSALEKETDPEAIVRLTQVAQHLYLKARTPLQGSTSLLGIALNFELIHVDPRNDPNADDLQMTVAVVQLQPGFPAAQDLQVGDRIIAIEHKPFILGMQIDDFRTMINARKPGTVVNFTIFRDGKKMDVAVQLAAVPAAGQVAIQDAVLARSNDLQGFLNSLKLTVPVQSSLSPAALSPSEEPVRPGPLPP